MVEERGIGRLATAKPRSLSAQLKPHMREINLNLERGVSTAHVVAALKEEGIDVAIPTLRVVLHRWRRAQGRTTRTNRRKGQDALRNAAPAASPIDSTNVIVNKEAPPADMERLGKLLDRKERENFGEEYLDSPTARWLERRKDKTG